MDVQLAVGGFVKDAGVALHGPLVQAEGHLWEGVQVQPRLPQHQRQHLRSSTRFSLRQSLYSVPQVPGLEHVSNTIESIFWICLPLDSLSQAPMAFPTASAFRTARCRGALATSHGTHRRSQSWTIQEAIWRHSTST